jgi:multicomponent Na+:H+ antiporter subunit A
MALSLPISLAVIFGAGFIAPLCVRAFGDRAGWVLAAAPFTAFGLLIAQSALIAAGGSVIYDVGWFSALDTSFGLRLDGLALMMVLLVTGVGGFIVVYAGGYMHGHPQLGRFFLYLLAFMGAMVGLVLSDNIILMFVFWELTSITSYLLIGFNHDAKSARWKALQALLVTGLGAMSMLAGLILISIVTGSYSFAEINTMGATLQESPFYLAIVLLILGGAFTKSAQVPFHFWLPNAMAGPTPVSAFLHSATMVKAGVFLLARLNPSLSGSGLWEYMLACFGGATLLLAMFLGLFQKDVKAILAYTTLGVLGILTLLLGLGSEYAIKGMVVFLIGHALYKATLFMVIGSVDHESGTRDVTLLRGLRKLMPITALAGGLAALSMSGLPPFFGFIGKELIYKAGLKLEGPDGVFLIVAFVGNLFMMGLALKAGIGPFFGSSRADELPKKPHEAPVAMWIGPLVLAGLGLMLGLFPGWITAHLVVPAVASVQGAGLHPLDLSLPALLKPSLALLLSALTVAGGCVVFLCRRQFWSRSDGLLGAIRPYGADAAYERIFQAIIRLSKWQTKRLQTGRLHDYVFIIAAATAALLVGALFAGVDTLPTIDPGAFDPVIAVLLVLMVLATLLVVLSDRYFTILGGLGTVGFGIALLFAYYGAPDLAITQLMVEALVVVLFMFVIYGLPSIRRFSQQKTLLRDGLLSGVFGLLVALLAWLAVNEQFAPPISRELAAMSYPEGKGKNVVNVILVDFRALDTFGEITVVAAAALGIAALLSSRLTRRKTREEEVKG